MAIKRTTEVKPEFAMSSLTDIIFLLLIFFMLTSSFVSPNALKLILPRATNPTMAKQTVKVSITKDLQYYVNTTRVSFEQLPVAINNILTGEEGESIVVNVDENVPTGELVKVMVIGKKLGAKVVLSTRPE